MDIILLSLVSLHTQDNSKSLDNGTSVMFYRGFDKSSKIQFSLCKKAPNHCEVWLLHLTTKEKWFPWFALHCGISEANVSFLCCTCAESLVHSIHLCTDVYRGTQCFWLLCGNQSLNVREPKKLKWNGNLLPKEQLKHCTPLLSFQKPQNQDPEACYDFLVGTYKATQNSIE